MEEWNDISGYEGLYKVSNKGKIKSVTRKTKFGVGYRIYEGQFLKPQEDKDGYFKIALSKDGKKKRFFVHRLVAITFINNAEILPVVNHKDGNKQNNQVDNLEWVTHSENVLHAIRTGLKTPSNGGTNKPVFKCDLNGNILASYDSMLEASKDNDISQQMIALVCKGKSKLGKGFVWKFK